ITDELSQESDVVLTYMVGQGVDIQQEKDDYILIYEKTRCRLTVSFPSQYTTSVEPAEVSVEYGIKSPSQAIRYRTRSKSIKSIITVE
ncbi:MAG: hypothetical protein J6Y97_04375, partial [Prevotella sp.]|nr:hypothetical protein [Prevotella sp.]